MVANIWWKSKSCGHPNSMLDKATKRGECWNRLHAYVDLLVELSQGLIKVVESFPWSNFWLESFNLVLQSVTYAWTGQWTGQVDSVDVAVPPRKSPWERLTSGVLACDGQNDHVPDCEAPRLPGSNRVGIPNVIISKSIEISAKVW